MKFKILLLFLTLSIPAEYLHACSCAGPYEKVFCKAVIQENNIVLAKVTDTIGYSVVEIVIIDNVLNEVDQDTIEVLGQDGLNCGESLGGFTIGDTLVFALTEEQWMEATTQVTYDWYLEGCGKRFLTYANQTVYGGITEDVDSMNFSDFKSSIVTCILTASTEDQLEQDQLELEIYPNPVNDILNVKVKTRSNFEYRLDLINARGEIIQGNLLLRSGKQQIHFPKDQPKGIYFIRIQNANDVRLRKVLYL